MKGTPLQILFFYVKCEAEFLIMINDSRILALLGMSTFIFISTRSNGDNAPAARLIKCQSRLMEAQFVDAFSVSSLPRPKIV